MSRAPTRSDSLILAIGWRRVVSGTSPRGRPRTSKALRETCGTLQGFPQGHFKGLGKARFVMGRLEEGALIGNGMTSIVEVES